MTLHDLHDEARIVRQTKKAPTVPDRAPTGISSQPVSSVEWVPRHWLTANDYNPNVVAPPELRLLKVSIMADGWTQPIVVQKTEDNAHEIVDGFHRWMVSADPDVFALTNGHVPIAILRSVDTEHQVMSTVRHNRARGSHHVLRMADIVQQLHTQGLANETIGDLLQMEAEEVTRFLDRGNMVKRGAAEDLDFNSGWVPE